MLTIVVSCIVIALTPERATFYTSDNIVSDKLLRVKGYTLTPHLGGLDPKSPKSADHHSGVFDLCLPSMPEHCELPREGCFV